MEPLTPDDEQQGAAKAERKWILLRGFGAGLTAFVITAGLDYYGNPALYPFNARGLSRILFRLTIWLVAGYFGGLWMARNVRKDLRK
jgi:hypothetical protein